MTTKVKPIPESLAKFRAKWPDQYREVDKIRSIPVPDALEYLLWLVTALGKLELVRVDAEERIEAIIAMREEGTRQ